MSTAKKKTKLCPQITDTSVTDGAEIRIQWTEIPWADQYAVKRAEKPDGEFTVLGWTKNSEYTDKAVKENITYWYRIVAAKVSGNKKSSKKAGPLAAQIVSSVPAPLSLNVGCEEGKIRLEWKKPAGVDSVLVYCRNEYFDQLLPVGTVEGNCFVDEDAVPGQIYHYSVQSLCADGQGNFSPEVSYVLLDSGEIISSKARFLKKVDLKARIVAGADGYIFERSEDGETFVEIGRTESDISIRYTDKTDKAFKVYYYRVRAFKNADGRLFVSEPSKAVSVKTK